MAYNSHIRTYVNCSILVKCWLDLVMNNDITLDLYLIKCIPGVLQVLAWQSEVSKDQYLLVVNTISMM